MPEDDSLNRFIASSGTLSVVPQDKHTQIVKRLRCLMECDATDCNGPDLQTGQSGNSSHGCGDGFDNDGTSPALVRAAVLRDSGKHVQNTLFRSD